MTLRFVHQVLVGSYVYGQGQVVDVDDRDATDLIRRGVAVEYVRPAPIREAVATEPRQARKAVTR